jgi:hypothetical protein
MVDNKIISALSCIPIALAIYALIQGARLSLKLKPGMVCQATTCCERCQILYGLEIGTVVLSLVYIIAKAKWIANGNFEKIASMDEMSWIAFEAAVMGFLGYLCRRGLECLSVHCDPNHECGKLQKIKEKQNGKLPKGLRVYSEMGRREQIYTRPK